MTRVYGWAASAHGCVQLPLAGHALETVDTPLVELEARAGDEVDDGLGHEHLPRPGLGRDPLADVDGDAADVAAPQLDLAGVDAGPHVDPQRPHRVADGEGAAHGPGRPVEGCEQAVAGCLDLS